MAPVVIVMGSKSDLAYGQKIAEGLAELGVASEIRVASAHKSAQHVLEMLAAYENKPGPRVFVTVAGRSNALGGMVDANTTWPVLTCPPISSTFGGADIYSSLRMPSGVAPMLVLEPGSVALAAAKILALTDADVRARVRAYQASFSETIVADDEAVRASTQTTKDA